MTHALPKPALPQRKRPLLIFVLKCLVAIILITTLFFIIPVSKVTAAMAQAGLLYVGIAVLFRVIMLILLSVQMYFASPGVSLIFSLAELTYIQFTTQFYNTVLPNELSATAIKWYRLSKKGTMLAQAFALVVYCRLVSMCSMLLIGFGAAIFETERVGLAHLRLPLGGLLVITLFANLPLWSPQTGNWVLQMLERVSTRLWLPKWVKSKMVKIVQVAIGFGDLPASRKFAVFTSGVFLHFASIGTTWFMCRSLAIDIGPVGLAWIYMILYVIRLFPITIAGLGVSEATFVCLLPQFYGVSPEKALAVSFLLFGSVLVVALAGGVVEAYGAFFTQKNR